MGMDPQSSHFRIQISDFSLAIGGMGIWSIRLSKGVSNRYPLDLSATRLFAARAPQDPFSKGVSELSKIRNAGSRPEIGTASRQGVRLDDAKVRESEWNCGRRRTRLRVTRGEEKAHSYAMAVIDKHRATGSRRRPQ